jgi:hypothetical protein
MRYIGVRPPLRSSHTCAALTVWPGGEPRPPLELDTTSVVGQFCCKSRLRPAAKRDSVVLTRFSARSIHDGPSRVAKVNCFTSFILVMRFLKIIWYGRLTLHSIYPGFGLSLRLTIRR